MRTKGFIFITMGIAAVSLAGSPGYLPEVGPVGLRFSRERNPKPPVSLPVIPAPHQPAMPTEPVSEMITPPMAEPPAPAREPSALMENPPIALPEVLITAVTTNIPGPLIGPMMETNGLITPQMFLRFFLPSQGVNSSEAIIVNPPGFIPAQPPAASSTATYSKPK